MVLDNSLRIWTVTDAQLACGGIVRKRGKMSGGMSRMVNSPGCPAGIIPGKFSGWGFSGKPSGEMFVEYAKVQYFRGNFRRGMSRVYYRSNKQSLQ